MAYRPALGEKLTVCPYDKSHLVSVARVHIHLAKCRRNYAKKLAAEGREVILYACKYSAAHQYSDVELGHHEKTCPCRFQVLPQISAIPTVPYDNPNPRELKKLKKMIIKSKMDIRDDWEVESLFTKYPEFHYIPEVAAEINKKVMRDVIAGTRDKGHGVQKPVPPRYNPELEYLFLSSSDDEDMDPDEREKRAIQDEAARKERFAEHMKDDENFVETGFRRFSIGY